MTFIKETSSNATRQSNNGEMPTGVYRKANGRYAKKSKRIIFLYPARTRATSDEAKVDGSLPLGTSRRKNGRFAKKIK